MDRLSQIFIIRYDNSGTRIGGQAHRAVVSARSHRRESAAPAMYLQHEVAHPLTSQCEQSVWMAAAGAPSPVA